MFGRIKAVVDKRYVLRYLPEGYRGYFDSQMGCLSLNNLVFLDKLSVQTVAYLGPTRSTLEFSNTPFQARGKIVSRTGSNDTTVRTQEVERHRKPKPRDGFWGTEQGKIRVREQYFLILVEIVL
jgi:hypothetical protein